MRIWTDIIQPWLRVDPLREDIFWFVIIVCVLFILHKVIKKLLLSMMVKVISPFISKNKLAAYIFKFIHFEKVSLIIYVIGFTYLSTRLHNGASILEKISNLIIIWIIAKLLHGTLDGLASYTENEPRFQGKPYRGYIQVFILIMYIAAFIIAAGTVSGKSPWALLSGIGAMTAVLLLVFRETILSFVASLQISSYDLVRRGDWISVPKYDADGDVKEVALHTIKIQNWDKTISVVPTNDLMQSGFKNWRGMQETGGRRIKRSIYLDVASVKFMDEQLREKTGKIALLKSYFEEIESKIDACYKDNTDHLLNDNRLTNLGTFRVYVTRYLQSLDMLRKDLTFLVRQLEPGPTGIPLEIYVFTATTKWAEYENIQADIFDHLFAAVHEFELRVFQYPVGGFMFSNSETKK
ncbi:mechanosensitive ion channel family protein [Treponema phagedenis]|uniref:Mechanosensitive ion channel family protein n=3 Tax=Treponema phagedenis TaxID=162 RepID=A0AAE6ISR3_TREPH|nr:mechanosensitive ion channel family protein [Treponema phagedenis]NVP23677.1 mechanosensitive ion channel family protein [Treponema phagedenis]QEJ94492.1 mechanosensitive ion channel family protein [Treponema phagedenis]QEJ97563.1 mechanosensitive ion channel family protein [Treponema phagedenis]QEK01626.1 mechanosensitive ion channel family protein [Treponema phagedenis]QEK03130.1 mechanosensitive ion channel family protein [Treponema phagedenis]